MEDEQKTEEQQKIINTPLQVTTKNPKRVEAGKRLAELNKIKREQLNQQKESDVRLYSSTGIGIGITISIIIGAIFYYNYRRKNDTKIQQDEPEISRIPKKIINKFEMD